MINEKWLALIEWCQLHPYTTIERLEIVEGLPQLLVVKESLTPKTTAFIKVKYIDKHNRFI